MINKIEIINKCTYFCPLPLPKSLMYYRRCHLFIGKQRLKYYLSHVVLIKLKIKATDRNVACWQSAYLACTRP